MNYEIKELSDWRHKAKRDIRDMNDDMDLKKADIRVLGEDLHDARRKYQDQVKDNEAL